PAIPTKRRPRVEPCGVEHKTGEEVWTGVDLLFLNGVVRGEEVRHRLFRGAPAAVEPERLVDAVKRGQVVTEEEEHGRPLARFHEHVQLPQRLRRVLEVVNHVFKLDRIFGTENSRYRDRI